MLILGRDKLQSFMVKHPRVRGPLAAWLKEAEAAHWRRWADIRAMYPAADLIRTPGSGHRVVFNIKGNHYRLVVNISFKQGICLVERIGTHAEYDRWNLEDPS